MDTAAYIALHCCGAGHQRQVAFNVGVNICPERCNVKIVLDGITGVIHLEAG